MPDINKDTGLPHTVTLGEVFNNIRLSPAHVTALLHNLAYAHFGGPNDDLARALTEQGNKVSDPRTYGNAPDAGPDNPQARWGQSTAQQGQSTLPATGTLTEPSWKADARAAGWTMPDANQSSAPTSQGSPPPTRVGSDRPRHFDTTRNQWVYNDTGETADVDVSPATPPQPAPSA